MEYPSKPATAKAVKIPLLLFCVLGKTNQITTSAATELTIAEP
jgi:hypothetical protein